MDELKFLSGCYDLLCPTRKTVEMIFKPLMYIIRTSRKTIKNAGFKMQGFQV